MNLNKLTSVPLWQFDSLNRYPSLRHFVSGREGGVSEGLTSSLNLSYKVNDQEKNVTDNRKRLAEALGVSPSKLIFPVQTHSNHVKVVQGKEALVYEDTDALITAEKNIYIAVQSADCVPILIYDPVQHVAAAVHAGWRGTVGRIVWHTVDTMRQKFASRPQDMIAAIGPSICASNYEVGEDVIQAIDQVFGDYRTVILSKEKNGKAQCNLWEANKVLLLEAGLKSYNIEIAGLCTYAHHNHFFSARKDGLFTGRFAAGILLK